jgi:hypothetical protein
MSTFLFLVELSGNILVYGLVGYLAASVVELLLHRRIHN